MDQRPDSYGPEVASAFEEASVVQAYRYRPSYPDEVFDWLDGLIVDQPRHVLDVGCGTGFLARSLVERVDRLDALDRSEAMIEEGRGLPGGQHPRLRWLIGDAEHAALQPPYALIVVGDCLHWFEWSVVMPRFASLLTLRGFLASLTVGHLPPPWQDVLRQLISRFSTNKSYREINIYAL
ncbi:methyltransferase family protein [Thermosporothrix hazakensis]|jgi:trans-aconitate methyltransferase|uniref:Methyltransferase family protein n=1 Tax=Thermosporothrix hazakensis TaxID=644383 RepID=A0A326US93_THEHA|nr:class I SAM-dependent methyltransferase [Thermosporothrix hazakensis]PZW34317.1 methyltransferase family protein [Thermosporothrix hazakensis]GCE46131.1 hypothetical protein KTH_10000 [Thermosporothrix hazakensis]